jgi:hypothetical protein
MLGGKKIQNKLTITGVTKKINLMSLPGSMLTLKKSPT